MHDFQVALSFAGEQRPLAAAVAERLSATLGRDQVFYDRYHEADLARLDLDIYLQALYHERSRLVVVFLGKDYDRKEWPYVEWRAVRDLIKEKSSERIVLVRVDDAPVPGVFGLDGYLDARRLSPELIADHILVRLRRLEPGPTSGSRAREPAAADGATSESSAAGALRVHVRDWLELDAARLAGDIVSMRGRGEFRPGMRVVFDAPQLRSLQQFVTAQANEGGDDKVSIEQLAWVDRSANALAKVAQVASELVVELYDEFGLKDAISSLHYFTRLNLMRILDSLARRQLGDREALYRGFEAWASDAIGFRQYAHAAYGLPRLVEVTVARHEGATASDLHVITFLPLGRLENAGTGELLRGVWDSASYIPRDVWRNYVIPQAAVWRVQEISSFKPLRQEDAVYETEGVVSNRFVDLEGGDQGSYEVVPKS
jgi:hypothetical protein